MNEGISDKVYHFTSIPGMVGIAAMDRFRLTFAVNHDIKSAKSFYLSLSRTGSGKIGYGRVKNHMEFPVKLELNGRKLGQRYSGLAVDYWGTSSKHYQFEYEDRLTSFKPHINHASKYIVGIHVYLANDWDATKLQKEQYAALVSYSNEYGVPLFFYLNEADWSSQRNGQTTLNTEHMLSSNDVKNYPDSAEYYDNMVANSLLPILAVFEDEDLETLSGLLPFEMTDDQDDGFKQQVWSLKRHAHSIYSITNDMLLANNILSNIKRRERYSNILGYVAQQFKKYRVKSITEYGLAKMAKLAPIEEKRNVSSYEQYIKKGRI